MKHSAYGLLILFFLCTLSEATCPGDFNSDGVVNFGDLAMLRSSFGSSDPLTDMNGDGVVNFGDLAAFRSVFGKRYGSATLSWDAPTKNEDGTVLDDLAGYRGYYWAIPLTAQTTFDTPAQTIVIGCLLSTTWYFKMTALDDVGNESVDSETVSKVIP